MSALSALDERIAALQAERRQLLASDFQLLGLPLINADIGHTYAYRDNTNGAGKWDQFRKLLCVVPAGTHATLIFQECCVRDNGRATLETVMKYVSAGDDSWMHNSGWSRCAPLEYENALEAALREINDPALVRRDLEKDAVT